MKKTTIILLCASMVVCLGLTGLTGYYIGSKTNRSSETKVATNPLEVVEETTISDNQVDIDAIKDELRDEVKDEVRDELYDEIYNQAITDVETELQNRIDALVEEQQKADEEAAAAEAEASKNKSNKKESTTPVNTSKPQTNNGGGGTSAQSKPAQTTPYIKVHDITCSMSTIQSAIYGAVDGSSGTVMCDLSNITGCGTYTVYWTASDGATATSRVTITE